MKAAKDPAPVPTHARLAYHRDLSDRPNMCDHCGTTSAALTVWPDALVCDCGCHAARRHDLERR